MHNKIPLTLALILLLGVGARPGATDSDSKHAD